MVLRGSAVMCGDGKNCAPQYFRSVVSPAVPHKGRGTAQNTDAACAPASGNISGQCYLLQNVICGRPQKHPRPV